MGRARSTAATLLLSAVCAGCESWSGFGFRADGSEMPRLVQVLALEPGRVVADVGAGNGALTVALARAVGPSGRVFSTEIDAARLGRLREAARAGELNNVTVLEAGSAETGLPAQCCDAIVLRRVYHHLTEPSSINASLWRSLRPGGVLAIIDFPPPIFFGRGPLGVPPDAVIREVVSGGFQFLQRIDDWPGRGPLASYCMVFRKP